MGFHEAFPIQAEAITPLVKGRDLIGQAQTVSGKTLAYALPMLQRVEPHSREIQGLVLVPTRNLPYRFQASSNVLPSISRHGQCRSTEAQACERRSSNYD